MPDQVISYQARTSHGKASQGLNLGQRRASLLDEKYSRNQTLGEVISLTDLKDTSKVFLPGLNFQRSASLTELYKDYSLNWILGKTTFCMNVPHGKANVV
jgi:hypothetical protein